MPTAGKRADAEPRREEDCREIRLAEKASLEPPDEAVLLRVGLVVRDGTDLGGPAQSNLSSDSARQFSYVGTNSSHRYFKKSQ